MDLPQIKFFPYDRKYFLAFTIWLGKRRYSTNNEPARKTIIKPVVHSPWSALIIKWKVYHFLLKGFSVCALFIRVCPFYPWCL